MNKELHNLLATITQRKHLATQRRVKRRLLSETKTNTKNV